MNGEVRIVVEPTAVGPPTVLEWIGDDIPKDVNETSFSEMGFQLAGLLLKYGGSVVSATSRHSLTPSVLARHGTRLAEHWAYAWSPLVEPFRLANPFYHIPRDLAVASVTAGEYICMFSRGRGFEPLCTMVFAGPKELSDEPMAGRWALHTLEAAYTPRRFEERGYARLQ